MLLFNNLYKWPPINDGSGKDLEFTEYKYNERTWDSSNNDKNDMDCIEFNSMIGSKIEAFWVKRAQMPKFRNLQKVGKNGKRQEVAKMGKLP